MRWQVLVLVFAVALAATIAQADMMDSANFTYKYEMNAYPSDVAGIDLDDNDVADFSYVPSGGSTSLSGGVLSLTGAVNFVSNTAGQIWPGNFSFASGYTVEVSMQVISSTGNTGAFCLFGSPSGTTSHMELSMSDSAVYWKEGANKQTLLSGVDNTDTFHVYRVAQTANATTYSVWRDGELLSDSLGSAYTGSYDHIKFGDIGGNWAGNTKVDYFRFTSGAYAPVPEPASLVLLSIGALGIMAYAWRKRK